ncbi:ABC transporter substrate-binding protein [Derxia lacustris]|uniref:ABC transporter substrate-binding protein n=1 Tax=Derxia lacustris TaxID=764842 RepID=UPI000A1714A7|nr:ABC transporter substrate-binding protein [Derxia lacustris]
MTSLLRRKLLQGGLAALAAPAVIAQPSLSKIRFTLDFRISGQMAPFFLALGKGYYREEGLDVNFDVGSGSVASITRVASGAYDMGFGDVSSLMEFVAQNDGRPTVQAVYQYYNRAPFAIIGRRDRGIADFKSLAGKRIAAAAVESTKRAWPMAARKLGMPADSLQWVTTDFSARDNVVVRGDVDGATYFHDSALSLFQRIKPAELAVLPFADSGVVLYGNAVLAGSKIVSENPKAVAGFVRATHRAMLECLIDPAPAVAFVKQREPLLDEATEIERFRITAQYVATAESRANGIGDVVAANFQQQLDEVAEVFALKVRPRAEAVWNPAFLPPRAQRLLRG